MNREKIKMTNTKAQLELLFEFEKKLNLLLDEEQYELFQQQQDLFTDQIKNLLDNNSENSLSAVIKELKLLESKIEALQTRSASYFEQLKEKSLLQKRNKNKIKAYK